MGMGVHFSFRLLNNQKDRRFLSGFIYIGVVVLFYLPVMFIVLVGPAAIAIYERVLFRQ